MPSYLLKEDDFYLLQETGDRIIISDVSTPNRLQLEVKRRNSGVNEIGYDFKITSNDIYSSVDLSNYRIVMYLNIRWKDGLTYYTRPSTSAFGGAVGATLFETPTDIYYNTEARPPNIFPQVDRFSVKRILKFKQGSLPTSGAGYAGVACVTHRGANASDPSLGVKPFYLYEHNSKYDYDPNNCRTSTEATSYESNPTFVLEFNDSATKIDPTSVDWQIVEEYISTSAVDPNTGQYPFGNVLKDTTTAYNRLTYTTSDNEIYAYTPTVVTNTGTTYGVTRGTGVAKRILERYEPQKSFEDVTIIDQVVSTNMFNVNRSEFWKFTTDSVESNVLRVDLLTTAFNPSTATWNTDSTNISAALGLLNIGQTARSYSDSYMKFVNNRTDIVKNWILPVLSATNTGVSFKQKIETNPSTFTPTYATSNALIATEHPFMVTNFNAASGQIVWTGATDTKFSDNTNWMPMLVPNEVSGGIFDGIVSTKPCILDEDVAVFSLISRSNAGSFDLSNKTLTVVGGDLDFSSLSALSQSDTGSIVISGCRSSVNFATSSTNILSTIIVDSTGELVIASGAETPILTSAFQVNGTCYLENDLIISGGIITLGEFGIIDSPLNPNNVSKELIIDSSTLNTSGVLNVAVKFETYDNNIPARKYGGFVTLTNTNIPNGTSATYTFDSGTFEFYNGLGFQRNPNVTATAIIDTVTNDPYMNFYLRSDLAATSILPLANLNKASLEWNKIGSTALIDDTVIELRMGTKTWIFNAGDVDFRGMDNITTEGGLFRLLTDVSNITPTSAMVLAPGIVINSTTGYVSLTTNNLYTRSFTMNTGAKLNVNGLNISATGDINILNGGSGTFRNLSKSYWKGNNIYYQGTIGDFIDITAPNFWYVESTNQLTALYAKLRSSDASPGVSGLARYSLDLGD